jgi:NADH:ubiquinone oxidoreductase subunit E
MDTKKLDELIEKHKAEKGPLISILHDIQRTEGYLAEDVLEQVGKKLKTPLSEISRVVTYFKKAFRLEPKGEKHTIRVCCGTTCHVKRSDEVLMEIQEELVKDSKNKDFAVEEVRCLGCCTVAPVVEIDGELVGKDSVNSTVIKLKGEIND